MITGATSTAAAPADPEPDAGGLPPELAPVAAALRRRAAATARSLRADAVAEAQAVASRADEQAAAILEQARRDGRAAARAAGSARAASANRQARETVLAARQVAYARLRSQVISGVEEQLAGPAGRDLRAFLAGLVGQAGGAEAVQNSGPGGWQAVAEGPAGRASIDVAALVDQVMQVFAPEIEQLWT